MKRSFRKTVLTVWVVTAAATAPVWSSAETAKPFSPFLIQGKMPHYAKLLKENWEDPALGLTATQKEQLLKVRKETMAAVQKLSPRIQELEQEVVSGIQNKNAPEELKPLVDELAALRAEATQIHLRCIADTRRILDARQFEWINKRK